ncbi:MAG: SpoIIE family protein phosphatase [Microscillaceae bacterium]|jgi:serine phosphatase RsbU (regulator of sigma subunit)|nr:SpoIIE family protein phosphatase [Microscillaceae bacterium]
MVETHSFNSNHLQISHLASVKVLKEEATKKNSIANDAAWFDNQVALIDEVLRDNLTQGIADFARNLLNYLAESTQAIYGVFYVLDDSDEYWQAEAGYACKIKQLAKKTFRSGEDLIGQTARSQKIVYLNNLPANQLTINQFNYTLSVGSMLMLPLVFSQKVYGVLEFYFTQNLPEQHLSLLEKVSKNIAITLASLLNTRRSQNLLAQTQSQKEIISQQESEMRANLEQLNLVHRELQKQSDKTYETYQQLKQNNDRILSSIRYAKNIQKAILPTENKLRMLFEEHLIIYEPKDMVSGDFYWVTEVHNKIIVAVVDCTGHGVPGAFMSMLGSSFLYKIVIENDIHNPAEILHQLHSNISGALSQDEAVRKDGMDVSICAIEFWGEKIQLTFAGAKCDLFYTKGTKLQKLKGNRHTIGGLATNQELVFSNQVVELELGDVVYMPTDGLLDICNAQRIRFGEKRFVQLVEKYTEASLPAQQSAFVEELKNYQGIADQRDDITLFAVRL